MNFDTQYIIMLIDAVYIHNTANMHNAICTETHFKDSNWSDPSD